MNKKERHYQEKRDTKRKHHDARVRWQETSMKQFTYVNYLVLTLSLAALGFTISLLFEDNVSKVIPFVYNHRASLLIFALSIVVGIICSIARLYDFRWTAKIARLKNKNGSRDDIEALRCRTKLLGERSWRFLWLQISLFLFGLFFLMLAIVSLWR